MSKKNFIILKQRQTLERNNAHSHASYAHHLKKKKKRKKKEKKK
jgi:hypothetical protein